MGMTIILATSSVWESLSPLAQKQLLENGTISFKGEEEVRCVFCNNALTKGSLAFCMNCLVKNDPTFWRDYKKEKK